MGRKWETEIERENDGDLDRLERKIKSMTDREKLTEKEIKKNRKKRQTQEKDTERWERERKEERKIQAEIDLKKERDSLGGEKIKETDREGERDRQRETARIGYFR